VAKKRVNRYPKAFRRMALERMKSCDNVSELARELNVDRSVLYHWRDQLAGEGDGTTIKSPVRELRREIRDLKRLLAEKTLEADFFQGALQKVEARRRSSSGSGETASTNKSEK
jgi:transposase-like protein